MTPREMIEREADSLSAYGSSEYLRALRETRADIVFERKKVPLGRNTPNTLDMYERQLLLNIDAKIADEMK